MGVHTNSITGKIFCAGTKKNGGYCEREVKVEGDVCFQHMGFGFPKLAINRRIEPIPEDEWSWTSCYGNPDLTHRIGLNLAAKAAGRELPFPILRDRLGDWKPAYFGGE